MAKKVSKRQVQIQVDVKTAQALGALKRLGKMNHRVFNRMSKDLNQMNSPWARFKGNIIAINQGLELMRRIARATFGQLIRMTNEAREQDKVLSDLAATLDRAGIGWQENSEQAMAFAATLQRTAGIADNETQRTMQLITAMGRGVLTSFDDVQNATEFVINASAQTGQGLESLGRIAARVANRDVAALQRSLPGLAAQLEVMKDAGASGSEMLAHMAQEMRGVAAEFDPVAIKIGRLAASWGDVREAIGGVMTSAIRTSPALTQLADKFDELAEAIQRPNSEVGRFVRIGLASVVGAAQVAAGIVARLGLAFIMLKEGVAVAIAGFELAISWLDRLKSGYDASHYNQEMTEAADAIAGFEAEIEELTQSATSSNHRRVRERIADLQAEIHTQRARSAAAYEFAEENENSWARATEASNLAGAAFQAAMGEWESTVITADGLIRDFHSVVDAFQEGITEGGGLDLGGDASGVDPLEDDAGESGQASGNAWAGAFLLGISEGFADLRDQAADTLGAFLNDWTDLIQKTNIAREKGADLGEQMGAGISEGLGTATQAIQAMTATIPTMMGDAATSGIQKFGATMQLLQTASTLAATSGVAAKAASSWLGPLSMFFGLAAATAAFAGAIGGAGSAGGDPAEPAREAAGADVADVLVGQRPEAARGGQARIIQMSIGSILSTDDSRSQIRDWIVEMGTLGELQGVRVGG